MASCKPNEDGVAWPILDTRRWNVNKPANEILKIVNIIYRPLQVDLKASFGVASQDILAEVDGGKVENGK